MHTWRLAEAGLFITLWPGIVEGGGRREQGGCPRTRPPWLMWFDLDSGPVIHQGLDLPVVPPRQIHLITGTLHSKLSAVSFVACRGTLLSSRGSESEVPPLDCLTWHLHAVPFIIVCIYCNERAGYFVKPVMRKAAAPFAFCSLFLLLQLFLSLLENKSRTR